MVEAALKPGRERMRLLTSGGGFKNSVYQQKSPAPPALSGAEAQSFSLEVFRVAHYWAGMHFASRPPPVSATERKRPILAGRLAPSN
jgi:hypothetical protein